MEDRGGRKGTGAWEPCSWHQAWPLGPRYCCCYELGGGSSCPVGASPHLGRGPFFWDVLRTALVEPSLWCELRMAGSWCSFAPLPAPAVTV